jgi:poly-gamma-glutamate synthesis protein (capsule biosynthesis protein)
MTRVKVMHASVAGAVLVAGVALVWPTTLKDAAVHLFVEQGTEEASISVLFVGDIMLDRAVAVHAKEQGDEVLFRGVEALFQRADALVGNLEGSITTNPSIAERNNSILRFTFDPRFAAHLQGLGFDALSLANNHALDFGAAGYEQTKSYLRAAHVASFGHPLNNKDLSTALSVKGMLVCLVGYHSLFDPDSVWVDAEIKKLRPICTYVVVMAHWGEEYQREPTPTQREVAHKFIDLGADVVIGTHPHIVQPVEIYKNRAIFYSLGNFLFDQGFQPEVKRGLAVKVEFVASTTSFTLTPVNTFKEVSLADATTTRTVLADVIGGHMPHEVADSILKTGSFFLPQ